jgi:hypothetical protein
MVLPELTDAEAEAVAVETMALPEELAARVATAL